MRAAISQTDSSPSPVASHRAHSVPNSCTTHSSYSATSSGVRVSAQRPLVPLLIKIWAPASQKAPQGNALGSIPLHPVKRTVLEDLSPLCFVDGDVEELCDAAYLPRHILFQIREVHEQDVRKVANLPPSAHVLPKRPEGVAVVLQPLAEILVDVAALRPGGCRLDQGNLEPRD
jgi:hypothetical protein